MAVVARRKAAVARAVICRLLAGTGYLTVAGMWLMYTRGSAMSLEAVIDRTIAS